MPGALPPHALAHEWTAGETCLWDNRSVQHSATPWRRDHEGVPGYAAAWPPADDARRLMVRTWLPSDWDPYTREAA